MTENTIIIIEKIVDHNVIYILFANYDASLYAR